MDSHSKAVQHLHLHSSRSSLSASTSFMTLAASCSALRPRPPLPLPISLQRLRRCWCNSHEACMSSLSVIGLSVCLDLLRDRSFDGPTSCSALRPRLSELNAGFGCSLDRLRDRNWVPSASTLANKHWYNSAVVFFLPESSSSLIPQSCKNPCSCVRTMASVGCFDSRTRNASSRRHMRRCLCCSSDNLSVHARSSLND